jgi:hypothetical protein
VTWNIGLAAPWEMAGRPELIAEAQDNEKAPIEN